MPSYERSVVITGGSSGIGQFCAYHLASARPDLLVIIASRTPPTAKSPENVEYRELDLASRNSVRSFASTCTLPIQALILNAGLATGFSLTYTPDGIETGFAVNHVGHALLFFLLKDKLLDDASIVSVSSATHDPKHYGKNSAVWSTTDEVARAISPEMQNPRIRYPTSKLANIMFAYALDRRAIEAGHHWKVNAYTPGFAPGTNLSRDAPWVFRMLVGYVLPRILWLFRLFGRTVYKPNESGAALADLVLNKQMSGKYISVHTVKASSDVSYDVGKQDELWDWTVKELAIPNAGAL